MPNELLCPPLEVELFKSSNLICKMLSKLAKSGVMQIRGSPLKFGRPQLAKDIPDEWVAKAKDI